MANEAYTQVNIRQLQDLLQTMDRAGNSCQRALENFSSAMNGLINSGQIEGAALDAYNKNMDTIRKLEAGFEQYCTTVKTDINNIMTDEQAIETEFKSEYDGLLNVNPEDFNE